jgi:TPR repeat protein
MGVAYGNGEGVDIDVVEGMKWMKLASENGFPQAIKFLESSRSSHHSPSNPKQR